jgi:hypothetical protein
MSYRQFKSLASVKEAFGLVTKEGIRFLPALEPIEPSDTLKNFLDYSLPVALATGSEKARSELIISPVLMEVRQILQQRISFFSGEEFTVDKSVGLNGTCDFLLSRSIELIDKVLTVDLNDYPLPPVAQILAFLAWMAEH